MMKSCDSDYDFGQEVECIYKNERYSVRDNGAVFRHSCEGKRPRPADNQWTFGKPNDKNYMVIASVPVHRIVASAFHGDPPTEKHVVDHIDTNKHNNRPENLRWLTQLENVVLNPITAKRIAYVCGSVEAFLSDPAKYRDLFTKSHEQWMGNVSSEEAKNSLERMLSWAKCDKPSSGRGSLDVWIFSRNDFPHRQDEVEPEVKNYILSLTPGAAQQRHHLNDKSYEYPCTPQQYSGNPLEAYAANLIEDNVFWRNGDREYVVSKYGFSKDRLSLYVMTKSAYVWREHGDNDQIVVPISKLSKEEIREDEINYQLGEITYEDDLFVHKRVESGFMPKEYLEEIFEGYIGKDNTFK